MRPFCNDRLSDLVKEGPRRTWPVKTYMGPDGLLNTQHPRPPSVFIDPDSRDVPDLNSVERPVVRNTQFDLQLVVVDSISSRNFIYRIGDLDGHIVVRKTVCRRVRAHMLKFRSNEHR